MPDYPHILSKNFLEDASITYDKTEDPVYLKEFLADRNRGSKFRGENDTPQHLVFDLGTARECDCFVLDRAFVITGGSGRHLKLQRSATVGTDNGSTWDADEIDLNNAALADNTLPIWKNFTEAVSRRYWRIRLEGLTAAPEIFNVWLGKRIQLTFGLYGDFDPWAERLEGVTVRSDGGGSQAVYYFAMRLLAAQFENLNDAKMTLIDQWWSEAGAKCLNWWWLWSPDSYDGSPDEKSAPVYFNSASMVRKFGFNKSVRYGGIDAEEAL